MLMVFSQTQNKDKPAKVNVVFAYTSVDMCVTGEDLTLINKCLSYQPLLLFTFYWGGKGDTLKSYKGNKV